MDWYRPIFDFPPPIPDNVDLSKPYKFYWDGIGFIVVNVPEEKYETVSEIECPK
jgi:hypothetical protein